MAKKVITMGEIMLRLSTPGHQRFVQANSFDAIYGGGEANVAVSLANYGFDSYFVTKLPKHEIGQAAVNELRKYGVHTDYIARGGERVGIYFSETGASMRPSKVIYDRANSSIAEAHVEDFDFNEIFKDAKWFHISGITPAISKNGSELTRAAMKAAKANNVTVSIDLNYRKKLWTPEEAQSVMRDLMQYVDVCIGNEEDASLCLGFTPKGLDVTSGKVHIDGYKKIFEQMMEEFGFKYVVSSLRESISASDNGWSACLYDGKEFYHSKRYDVRIIDRVGGGDSFASGIITGLLDGKSSADTLEFAVAASALKHTIIGDFNHMSREEVENLVAGDASGRVQR
ncbi:sugar kinase [Treponema phagedenis]|uniref:sugar kinase n=1 Tax=Treponema phagedenis TaxID=162 RepID=UPI0004658906|nr:sugar kinase [Treponema phagedenis]NVP25261.1 sugar kinase [Treponema phagedenis]QEK02067.1 sugar kinase [Treponema phagedenis]QKS91287.1 sugar kinase [Treponema phagedenis]QLC59950.1 sugar kinase [Treponema phagedenis]QSH94098.1 sugar kinase [Treponema phagedenis]